MDETHQKIIDATMSLIPRKTLFYVAWSRRNGAGT